MSTTTIIKSVSEFIECVSNKNHQLKKEKGRYNILLFRGQSDCDNILLPSIGRHSDELIDETFLQEERNMVEMAKYKLPELFNSSMQPIDLLALLQHHGIPTRLLDISENALVALYFACSEKKNKAKDGEVLVFAHDDHKVEDFPIVNAIADSYRFVREDITSLKKFYENVEERPYFSERTYLKENGINSSYEGAKWIYECCQNILIIYAKSYGLRQRIQRGRYILFPNSIQIMDDGNMYFKQSIDPISKEHESIVQRFVIPACNKQRIMEDLRILGISKDMLFLDNDDIICREIADRVKNN